MPHGGPSVLHTAVHAVVITPSASYQTSRPACRRRYEYILPAFAFDLASCQSRSAAVDSGATCPADGLATHDCRPAGAAGRAAVAPVAAKATHGAGAAAAPRPQAPRAAGSGAADAAAADVAAAAAASFAFDEACEVCLTGILDRFCGTHTFHNFTVKVQSDIQKVHSGAAKLFGHHDMRSST